MLQLYQLSINHRIKMPAPHPMSIQGNASPNVMLGAQA
jgi:hypothetical protein